MKVISIGEGILVAVVLTLLLIPVACVVSMLGLSWFGVKIAIGALLFSYIAYLLAKRKNCAGRFTAAALSLFWIAGTALVPIDPLAFTFSCVFFLWLMRSVLSYQSLIASFLDGVLTVISLIFALFSYLIMGSFIISVWVFFLMQSLHVLIGPLFKKSNSRVVEGSASRQFGFDQAMRTAEAALSQIR